MKRRRFVSLLILAATCVSVSLAAAEPDLLPVQAASEAGAMIPVPPVEGVPGPLFFGTVNSPNTGPRRPR